VKTLKSGVVKRLKHFPQRTGHTKRYYLKVTVAMIGTWVSGKGRRTFYEDIEYKLLHNGRCRKSVKAERMKILMDRSGNAKVKSHK